MSRARRNGSHRFDSDFDGLMEEPEQFVVRRHVAADEANRVIRNRCGPCQKDSCEGCPIKDY